MWFHLYRTLENANESTVIESRSIMPQREGSGKVWGREELSRHRENLGVIDDHYPDCDSISELNKMHLPASLPRASLRRACPALSTALTGI